MAKATGDIKRCLEQIFGTSVDTVDVDGNSFYAKLHGSNTIATTRKNKIYLNISTAEFWDDQDLILHEYFHVIRQWNTGELTIAKYIIESMKSGYWNNKYEVEAREFASRNLDKFKKCLEECRE